MGRGRQKAKQTKVARRLKYYSPETDYDALQRELGTSESTDYADIAARYADPEGDEDEDESEDDDWGQPPR